MSQWFYDELVALPPSVFGTRTGREPCGKYYPRVGTKVRLLEPTAPGGCDRSNLMVGGVHEVVGVGDEVVYFGTGEPKWYWRRDSIEPVSSSQRGAYLVPVRRGGSWAGGGTKWEVWRAGRYENSCSAYRVHDGHLEAPFSHCDDWFRSHSDHDLHEIELHPPKPYDGPCPEGCGWVEEGFTPQGKPSVDLSWDWGKYVPKPGDRVALKRDEGSVQEGILAGSIGTVRNGKPSYSFPAVYVEWDVGDIEGAYLTDIEPTSRGWTPKKGDRVLYKQTGKLGTIHIVQNPTVPWLEVKMDSGGHTGGPVSWFEPVEEEWTPKVGDRVRGSRDDWKGLLGTIRQTDGFYFVNVQWDEGQRYAEGNPAIITQFADSYRPAEYLEPAPRIRPDGTLDLPVRKVSREEWRELVSGKNTYAILKSPQGPYEWSNILCRQGTCGCGLLRVKDGGLQHQYLSKWTNCYSVSYSPGDEDHMEWIVCEED